MTPLILPPDGDMAAYLHSLELLKGYQPRAIAPGHGRVLTDPVRVIDGIVAHRARREAKVVGVLAAAGRGDTDELLLKVYDDVRRELLPIARYSLEAHLIKLEREGRAAREAGVWSLRDGAPSAGSPATAAQVGQLRNRGPASASPSAAAARADERGAGKQAGEE